MKVCAADEMSHRVVPRHVLLINPHRLAPWHLRGTLSIKPG